MDEHIVLVNDDDEVIGVRDKVKGHNAHTPLHRGVSVFVFNSKGEILLQKRHPDKKTWPGFWSNSFCGHPQIHETYEQAALRRGAYELGLRLGQVMYVAPYRYRFEHNGIVEHEICPIFRAISDDPVQPHPQEISQTQWLSWPRFLDALHQRPEEFSPWCREEVHLIQEIVERI